ncbi:Nucleobase-ascorbate transporter 4 [Camellia lanceoleosa]|uniref:Nucleobase-ascorbate transporter 4 n=1 Tax=Camellia lanceoleosa TaxID=1840588 RepID=A0ACC0GBK8_9ERIC|nr:Nucleobase-ascorbate transporter 4 [Camellia lanceoleosa]
MRGAIVEQSKLRRLRMLIRIRRRSVNPIHDPNKIPLFQDIPHWFKTKRAIFECFFERYTILLSIAIIWPYTAFLTAAGAYNKRPPNTQSSCRVDRSWILEGASWLLLHGLS